MINKFLALLLKAAPTLVGILLLYAGIYKILFPSEATYALEALSMSYGLAAMIIATVTILELYLGVCLICKICFRFTLIAASSLFFGFTLFLWYLSTLADPPGCGCLGLETVFESTRANAVFGILRNCVILWVLKAVYQDHFRSLAGLESSQSHS